MAKGNGQALKFMLRNGPVLIRLNTEVKTGFWKIPVVVADLQGKVEPEKFVLFGAHTDSWYKGASDNGTGNACILETARILSKYRDHCIGESVLSGGRVTLMVGTQDRTGMLTVTGKICTITRC
jgi:hypothetical protein